MKRGKYISDHLVDIRERFRQTESVPVRKPDDDTGFVSSQTAAEPETPAFVLPPPAPRMAGRDASLEREKRELDGRLRHDCALISAELELCRSRLKECEAFQTVLSDLLPKVESAESAAELENISRIYYPASGRWQAWRGNPAIDTVNAGRGVENQSSGSSAVWILALAIVFSALLVCLVWLVLFA